jgi:hypothetical protein
VTQSSDESSESQESHDAEEESAGPFQAIHLMVSNLMQGLWTPQTHWRRRDVVRSRVRRATPARPLRPRTDMTSTSVLEVTRRDVGNASSHGVAVDCPVGMPVETHAESSISHRSMITSRLMRTSSSCAPNDSAMLGIVDGSIIHK